jgi:hypothetical protein
MRRFFDFVWPTLESGTPDVVPQQEIDLLRAADFSQNTSLALSEAQRISSDEEERRKTAESKASNFLLVAAGLVPVLTYLETAIWDAKVGTAPKWLTLTILSVAVAYLIASVIWALRAVAIGNYHRIGSSDLLQIWRSANIQEQLTRETLIATRSNHGEINRKVSAFKMTHLFMVRAILVFCLLVLVQAFAEIGHETDIRNKVRALWSCLVHAPSASSDKLPKEKPH